MIYENIEEFTDGLIEQTQLGILKWTPLSSFYKMKEINKEFDNGFADIDFGVNSVRESASFFLKANEGYVFLFEIYHGDPDVTSPEFDTLQLMVKINSFIPIINLSGYMIADEEYQQKLENLKLLIENYIEEKYCMPDALYKFMNQVLNPQSDQNEEDV